VNYFLFDFQIFVMVSSATLFSIERLPCLLGGFPSLHGELLAID